VEAHAALINRGYKNIYSYGTSAQCKLPGPSFDKPNVYNFGTSYRKIYEDLRRQNPELYKANGLLNMLERNMRVKEAPERWQDEKRHFDIVIAFEERVFDALVEDIMNRVEADSCYAPCHIFNFNTKDNHDEATVSAAHVAQFVQMLASVEDFENDLDRVLEEFQKRISKEILHNILFY